MEYSSLANAEEKHRSQTADYNKIIREKGTTTSIVVGHEAENLPALLDVKYYERPPIEFARGFFYKSSKEALIDIVNVPEINQKTGIGTILTKQLVGFLEERFSPKRYESVIVHPSMVGILNRVFMENKFYENVEDSNDKNVVTLSSEFAKSALEEGLSPIYCYSTNPIK